MRKVQLDVIQEFVTHDPHLQRGADHSAQELCDVGGISSDGEGHHGFCSGAVPAGRESFLKENDPDFVVSGNFGRFHMGNAQAIDLHNRTFTKTVNNFTEFERRSNLFFDFGENIFQIGVGKRTAAALAYLHHQHGIHIGIVLFIGILIPARTLFQPFLHRSFQQNDIVLLVQIVGVNNGDTVFQQAGAAHLIGGDNTGLLSNIGDISNQCVKPIRCGADAQNHRHGTHPAFDTVLGVFIALDKALHDGCICTGFPLALGTTVGLVNDEVQPVSFILDGVVQRFPDGILTIIGMLRQFAISADFLGVQEINMAILQHFHVEGLFCNGNTLAKAQLAGLQLDLLSGLGIQFRRIGQPYKNGFRLLLEGCSVREGGAEENILDQCSGNNGLAGTGGGLQRDYLGFLSAAVVVHGICNIQPQILDSFVLKSY